MNIPVCPHCQRPMQLNAVASNDRMKQYLCGCQGIVIHHVNVHEGQGGKKN